jgi:hypothetical protein
MNNEKGKGQILTYLKNLNRTIHREITTDPEPI